MIKHALESFGTCLDHLSTTGYAVVPSFLSSDDIDFLCNDFKTNANPSNKYSNLRFLSKDVINRIKDRFDTVMQKATEAGVHTNLVVNGYYFRTEKGGRTLWHNDYETYFVYQNHLDYLNFYIPLEKPVLEKSNLSLVPLDALQQRSPEVFEKIVGGGALGLAAENGMTKIYNNNQRKLKPAYILDYEIDEISVTPHLNSGDLLMLRGDVIHKTQDMETERLAVSIRSVNRDNILNRKSFVKGGLVKYQMMVNNWELYIDLMEHFKVSEKEEITIGEYEEPSEEILNKIKALHAKSMPTKRSFVLSLLKEKFITS